jgi:hypothetical protein
MAESSFWIAGELATWPSKRRMASILRDAGLKVDVGQYDIRVEDCSHFAFEEYGGDLGDPQIEADAESLEKMLREGELVSDALVRAGIRHRFEIYNGRQPELVGYLHHDWPLGVEENPGQRS